MPDQQSIQNVQSTVVRCGEWPPVHSSIVSHLQDQAGHCCDIYLQWCHKSGQCRRWPCRPAGPVD